LLQIYSAIFPPNIIEIGQHFYCEKQKGEVFFETVYIEKKTVQFQEMLISQGCMKTYAPKARWSSEDDHQINLEIIISPKIQYGGHCHLGFK